MRPATKSLFAGVTAAALLGGTALAQQVILVPQGQGPAGAQQFILVPIPQDQAQAGADQSQGAGQQQQGAQQQQGTGQQQQGTGQQGQAARQQQMRDRAETMAMDFYRRGYQRGVVDAQSTSGTQIDPAAMEQIGRELFERGYMLGMMQARAHMAGGQMPSPGDTAQSDAGQTGSQADAGSTAGQTGQQSDSQAQQAQAQETSGQQTAQQQTGQQQGGQQLVETHLATGQSGFPDATITVDSSQDRGQYLVDDNDRAVYLFTADKQAQGDAQKATSTCYDDCAKTWPPVLTQSSEVRGVGDVKSDMLSTIKRKDGTTQVTYNGWPLYYYVEDEGQAETKGQDVHGFGGAWYLLDPQGEKAGEG